MYWFDTKRHRSPHVHAQYDGRQAVFDLDGSRLAGEIGTRASRLVVEFVGERQIELRNAWERAIRGEEVPWIKPIS